jgi:rhodanese-related sulfurtransferase
MPVEVTRDDVRRLREAGALLFEVLPSEEYGREHIPGAINLPLKELDSARVADLDRAAALVVYCSDAL